MKVYVLSSGRYSDWTLRGIFSSMESLDVGKAKMSQGEYDDWNDPQEWEVDEILSHEFGPTWVGHVHLKTGKTEGWEKGESLRHPTKCDLSSTVPGFHDPQIYVISPISQEHAVKVATEKRQEWLRTEAPAPITT